MFKYLVRVLTKRDDDWPEVADNMRKDRKRWTRMTRILIWEGEYPKLSGLLFEGVVQAVLIFGAEMWVLTPRMERAVSSFQHRVAPRKTGRQIRQRGKGRY